MEKKYIVYIPVETFARVEVTAESEEKAKKYAEDNVKAYMIGRHLSGVIINDAYEGMTIADKCEFDVIEDET